MDPTLQLSSGSRSTAGVLLLTILFIEYGGWFVLRVVRGHVPMTEFQKSFARAGHAHAGVLVTLALVGLILVDAADVSFFLSSAGRDVVRPNRLIVLLYAGMATLALGVASLGIGLLTT
jgi:hypothetical protein